MALNDWPSRAEIERQLMAFEESGETREELRALSGTSSSLSSTSGLPLERGYLWLVTLALRQVIPPAELLSALERPDERMPLLERYLDRLARWMLIRLFDNDIQRLFRDPECRNF